MRALVVVAMVAGCYGPEVDVCAIGCDPESAVGCPSGLTCGADFHCHGPGEEQTCTFPVTLEIDNSAMLAPVVVIGEGVQCSESCQLDVLGGQALALDVQQVGLSPSEIVFVAFEGCDDEGRNRCSVRVDGPTALVAHLLPGRAVSVDYFGDGLGVVESTPSGITCSAIGQPSCNAVFGRDEQVELRATPTPPSRFLNWSLPECEGIAPCVLPGAASGVTATFDAHRLSVTAVGLDNDVIMVDDLSDTDPPEPCIGSCTKLFDPTGSRRVRLTASTVPTRRLDSWLGISDCEQSTSPICEFDVLDDAVAVGVFKDRLRLTLNVIEGQFTLSPPDALGVSTCPELGPASLEVCTLFYDPGQPVEIDVMFDSDRMLTWGGSSTQTCQPDPGPFDDSNLFSPCQLSMTKNVIVTGEFLQPTLEIKDVPGNNNAFVSVAADGNLQSCGPGGNIQTFAPLPFNCAFNFTTGTAIELTAGGVGTQQQPFSNWVGCPGTAAGNKCSFVLDRNHSVTPVY